MNKLLFALLFFSSFHVYAQDSLNENYERSHFGVTVGLGGSLMEFSSVRSYAHMANRPKDFHPFFSIGFNAGNAEKFFGTIRADLTTTKESHAVVNGYNTNIKDGVISLQAMAVKPFLLNYNRKGFKAMYACLGARYTQAGLFSRAIAVNGIGSDSSFYFENSTVKSVLINAELMFEFLNVRPKKLSKYGPMPVALRIGYSFMLSDPQWSGITTRIPGEENLNVNLGGFYATIGFNPWFNRRKD